MDYTDRLRLLALNDARLAEELIGPSGSNAAELDPKTLALVRLAALVAAGGTLPSYGAHADAAVGAGATAPPRSSAVLVGVVDIVGTALCRRRGADAGDGARLRHRRGVRAVGVDGVG